MQTEKLYSPLEFYIHNPREEEANGEYGMYDLHDERYKASHFEISDQYSDAIELAIQRDRDSMDKTRGMAEYLPEELQGKIHSLFPSIEQRGSDLYCAAVIELTEALTLGETATLKDWWSGQLSDGWGEGFEQHEISVGFQGNELYVVPWTSDGNEFFLDTGTEFAERIGVDPAVLGVTAETATIIEATTQSPLMEAKLYSPVFVYMWEYNDNGSYKPTSIFLGQRVAALHIDEIHAAILNQQRPEEAQRGLMTYYNETDSINAKVRSLFLDVEIHENKLWTVANLKLEEPLSEGELLTLSDYMEEQYSGGWGEDFKQMDIKVENGELNVHLWSANGEFFIATQDKFSQALGIKLPADALSQFIPPLSLAQKALYEPDMFDSENVAALREQLIARIDGNLSDYFDTLRSLDGKAITGMSSEIALVTEAHFYLSDIYNFHLSDVQYLLQFKNPLEVVADGFEADGFDNQRSDAMWKIFDRQDALGDYELVSDNPTPNLEELVQRLHDRLDENLNAYKRDTLELSKEGLYYAAAEIAVVQQSYDYFRGEHAYTTEQTEFLLKLQNPLELLSDRWSDGIGDYRDVVNAIFSGQERTLSSGSYELASDDSESPPTTINTQEKSNTIIGADSGDKPSVLDEIRQAKKATRDTPTITKEIQARKKTEQEL